MKIAVLGPKGTYSDIAKDKYLENNGLEMETVFYPSVIKSIESLKENDYALVPFENSLDGFIMESLDRIIGNGLNIVSQIKLSIDFCFVANVENIEDVEGVYCQFKAYGQCLDFITENDLEITKTESNIESLDLFKKEKRPFGAIIPTHALKGNDFKLVIERIADRESNETRFFVLSKNEEREKLGDKIEISILLKAVEDKPGILFQILERFHNRNINLKCILSRPSKLNLGSYGFYIECSLFSSEMKKFDDLVKDFSDDSLSELVVLGVYNAL